MIKTIKLRELIKYLVGLIAFIIIAVGSTRFFLSYRNKEEKQHLINFNVVSIIKSNIIVSELEQTIDVMGQENNNKRYTSRSGINRLLSVELPNIEKDENESKEIAKENEEEKERTITEIKDTYTNKYGSVTVKNLTDIKLTESILKPDFMVSNKKDILIFHTHTCESYTQTKENSYKPSGNFRTTDLKYSVVGVGRVLEDELKKYKFNVYRDETKHDYPAYTGSYTRSLETVEKMLKNNKNAEIVFDVHRDAVGSKSDYAPTVEINGEKVTQLMFVIGTNDGGGKHPNWKNNLKFAVKIQEKANEMYPGLFRSINLRSSTFNQKVTNAASIIEVGATGNTLEEAEASMKYLAKVLNEVLNN